MKARFILIAGTLSWARAWAAESEAKAPAEVPYPDGYRQWQHVCSVVMPAKAGMGDKPMSADEHAAPHGLIFHVYANDLAKEGYRSGRFPEGSVLIADWFFLEEKGPALVQGERKSTDVMIRDARFTTTGGWGFENFERESHTERNAGPKAVKTCFECHSHAKEHEYVFSTLKP